MHRGSTCKTQFAACKALAGRLFIPSTALRRRAAESQQARNDLERLSEETGGVAYFARSMADVNSIAAEVARTFGAVRD